VFVLYRAQYSHLDCVAPDICFSGYRDFQRLCAIYSADGNPLYMESSTGWAAELTC
jgi:hypothetical protein